MAEHTPGPWAFITVQPGDRLTLVTRNGGLHLAYLDEAPGLGHSAEANTRLIAAAPTMRDYIARRAKAGDAEAASILEAIDAHS